MQNLWYEPAVMGEPSAVAAPAEVSGPGRRSGGGAYVPARAHMPKELSMATTEPVPHSSDAIEDNRLGNDPPWLPTLLRGSPD